MPLDNSKIPYQGSFYVAIFPDDYAAFPEPPAAYLRGRCVVVRGSVETYRGAPQIVLRHPDDLRVLDAAGDPSEGPSDGAPRRPSAEHAEPAPSASPSRRR